jgi:peroxiredoxin
VNVFKMMLAGLGLMVFTIVKADTDTTLNRGYIVKVGDMAPNITLEYTDGSRTNLSDLKGKVVLLQFTASWCSVCREEMPHLEKDIWKKYRDKGLVFAGIDLKEPIDKVVKFERTMKITYPLTLDTSGSKFYSFAAPGAGVTRNILIGRDGKIIYLTRLYTREEFEGLKEEITRQFSEK